jgi:hypothetical protein
VAVQPSPADAAKPGEPVQLPGLAPLPPPGTGTYGPAEPIRVDNTDRPGGEFFADAEYLFLKPHRRDLDFAIVNPGRTNDPEGSIQSVDWTTRSGFRAGAGYRAPDQGWEIGFFYTYFHDDQTAFAASPNGGELFATMTHPGTIEFADRARAEASLSYNVFDLEAGRRFSVGEIVTLRPFGGARFAHIDQNVSVLYDGADANMDQVGSRLKFDGGGPRLGGEADWKFLEHFSLYGRAAGSLMIGDFRSQQTEVNNGGATVLTNVSESFRKVVPVLEMGFGVGYEREHLRLSVGYEIIDWFGLVDTPAFINDVHQGKYTRNLSDLSLEGVAVRAEVRY